MHALFRSCTFVGNAEDLDIVMDMYSLLECRDIFSMTQGSLLICQKERINDAGNENNAANNRRINKLCIQKLHSKTVRHSLSLSQKLMEQFELFWHNRYFLILF